jgi:hypothetical protein
MVVNKAQARLHYSRVAFVVIRGFLRTLRSVDAPSPSSIHPFSVQHETMAMPEVDRSIQFG